MANSGGETEEQQLSRIGKTLKEGERILAPTRRPDGTMRKPVRIRAGYVPQDEIAIYQSKGALMKKGMGAPEVPPGYDPDMDVKPKTKSAKRNERKKEKKQQAASEKGKNLNSPGAEEANNGQVLCCEDLGPRSEAIESVSRQMNTLDISTNPLVSSTPDAIESSNPETPGPDLDKKIRALKKKIRLTEAQVQKTGHEDMKPEQLEKVAKLESWRQELKLLEDKKAELPES